MKYVSEACNLVASLKSLLSLECGVCEFPEQNSIARAYNARLMFPIV